jgi:hypothetical protein
MTRRELPRIAATTKDTSGYVIASAINHYVMTGRTDARLYDAARKLADS